MTSLGQGLQENQVQTWDLDWVWPRSDPEPRPASCPGPGRESLAVIGRCWRGLYLFFSSFSSFVFAPSASSEETGGSRLRRSRSRSFHTRNYFTVTSLSVHTRAPQRYGSSGQILYLQLREFSFNQTSWRSLNNSLWEKINYCEFLTLFFFLFWTRLRGFVIPYLIYSVTYDLYVLNSLILFLESSVCFCLSLWGSCRCNIHDQLQSQVCDCSTLNSSVFNYCSRSKFTPHKRKWAPKLKIKNSFAAASLFSFISTSST